MRKQDLLTVNMKEFSILGLLGQSRSKSVAFDVILQQATGTFLPDCLNVSDV